MSKYLIPITTKTLDVYEIEARNGTEAAFALATQIAAGLKPAHSRTLSTVVGKPSLPVADTGTSEVRTDRSAQADVKRAHDDEDREHNENGDNDDAGSGAHGNTVPPPASGQTRGR